MNGILGSMIQKAGAGPEPIPQKQLNVDNLTEALKFAISPGAKDAAKRMGQKIEHEVCYNHAMLNEYILRKDHRTVCNKA